MLLGEKSEASVSLDVPEPLPELANLLEQGLIDDPPVIARGSRGANRMR